MRSDKRMSPDGQRSIQGAWSGRSAWFVALSFIGALIFPTAGFCDDDATSRELTVFPYTSTADGGVISRELTAYVGGVLAQSDAVSRELTVYPDTLLAGMADAVSREWTVFPNPAADLPIDALSREISLWFHLDWTSVSDQPAPGRFELARPFPNPVARDPQLRLGLPAAANVSLEWFDVSGRCVSRMRSEQPLTPGWYDLKTDTARWGRGLYFYRLQAGPEVWNGKVAVMR